MAIMLIMRTGHQYRVADSLTLTAVNDTLDANPNRFVEVPLAADAAAGPGTPGEGKPVQHLFITPDSVSHFVVV